MMGNSHQERETDSITSEVRGYGPMLIRRLDSRHSRSDLRAAERKGHIRTSASSSVLSWHIVLLV
jgi:hypothetical protein